MILQASFVPMQNHELHLQDLTATFDDSNMMFQDSGANNNNNNGDSELDIGMSISDFLEALRTSSLVESDDDDDDDSKSVDSITYYKRKGQLPGKESKD
jgi:hypothetical protein